MEDLVADQMDFQDTFRDVRVLVTGDTGFKGTWLCEWLQLLGADIVGIGLAPNTQPALFEQLDLEKRIDHREVDIRDVSAVRHLISNVQPDIILHLAAQPLVRLSYEIPIETYTTNVMGTVHILDAVRQLNKKCAVVCVTTDKCYENREWLHSYREEDSMGGHDPYSSSKGACEIAIQSFRKSYFDDPEACGVAVSSVRAGNVIGGGDWALDRIIPDCVRALQNGESIPVRNKVATRPWQHVLEPLGGYLLLAAELWRGLNGQSPLYANFPYTQLCGAFNFGPELASNRSVSTLVQEALKSWEGNWIDQSDPNALHEASLLNLSTDKAHHMLGWSPQWSFEVTIQKTMQWYLAAESKEFDAQSFTQEQIRAYCSCSTTN